jgi:hypothetical protein
LVQIGALVAAAATNAEKTGALAAAADKNLGIAAHSAAISQGQLENTIRQFHAQYRPWLIVQNVGNDAASPVFSKGTVEVTNRGHSRPSPPSQVASL